MRRARRSRSSASTSASGSIEKAGARTTKEARKANKRGAARLAAVQALYQMDLAATGLNEIWRNSRATGSAARSRARNIGRPRPRISATSSAAWCASKASSTRRSMRLWPRAGRSSASRRCCARCCAPAPTNSLAQGRAGASRDVGVCRRRRRLRRATRRPAWSMPCSSNWRTDARRRVRPRRPDGHGRAAEGSSHDETRPDPARTA